MPDIHYHDTPVEYVKTDCATIVKIHGKSIGLLFRLSGRIGFTWGFSPFRSGDVYTGYSMDMAVLNYLAHQYGGGLDG